MGFFDAILFPFIWFDSAILVGFEWLLTRAGLPDTTSSTCVERRPIGLLPHGYFRADTSTPAPAGATRDSSRSSNAV